MHDRFFGTNSLKEETMKRVQLGNDVINISHKRTEQ
jgi:hypothetical protein